MSEATSSSSTGSPAGQDGAATAPSPRRGPSRGAVVMVSLLAGAALFGLSRLEWARALAPDLTGTDQQVSVLGADAAPAVPAFAIVAIAAALATTLSSSWVRFVTGPLLALSGAAAAAVAWGVHADPVGSSTGSVAQSTGVVGGQIQAEPTMFPLLVAVPAIVLLACGVVVIVRGGRWPRRTRYRRADLGPEGSTPAADPRADPAAAWDALTRGEDPSEDAEDAEAAEEAEPAEDAEPQDGGADEDGAGGPTRPHVAE